MVVFNRSRNVTSNLANYYKNEIYFMGWSDDHLLMSFSKPGISELHNGYGLQLLGNPYTEHCILRND